MTPTDYSKIYTDAPKQYPNLILGSLQLLFWIFFRPSAWRNHITRIDPNLRPDFCLAELSRTHWHQPALRKLLIQAYIILPVLVGLLIGCMLLPIEGQAESVAVGVAVSVAVGVAVSVAVGVAVSVAVGVAVSVGFFVALLVPFFVEVGVPSCSGVAGGVAGGVASSIATSRKQGYFLGRQVGGVVIGIIIVGILALGVAAGLPTNRWILGVAVGVAVGVAIRLRTNRWILGVVVHVAFCAVLGITLEVAYGVAQFFLFILFFALPYVIVDRVAGTLAGAVAGTLGNMGLWLVTLIISNDTPSCISVVIGTLFGFTWTWWRPVALYPLLLAANTLLYQADQRRSGSQFSLLGWHSAFWDEHQRLPLVGLDEHILLIAERNPIEGQAAINYLTTSRQRWAVQALQIELDIRSLERCKDVKGIRQVHRQLEIGEIETPISPRLRLTNRISENVDTALNQESAYNQRLALRDVADKIDLHLQEFNRSNDKYASRFYLIARSWCEIITKYIEELAKETELRQEIDSPYIIGVPLTQQQEIFTGRNDIGTRIEQLLLDRRRPPLLLYGQRRMGKTSLLYNLGKLLPNTIIPLFVDLQGAPSSASDYAGFLYNLARGMITSAKRQSALTLPSLTREELEKDAFTSFDEWLDKVEQALQDNTALLSLDEFEVLDSAINKGRFDEEDVLGMLRNLIQHRPKFKVLIAGSHTIQEYQRWASYFINVQVVHISYLKEDEARQLIKHPVKDFTLRYERDAVERVLQLTRCHPFLVQLLCAEIVALKNEQNPSVRRLATLTDVEAGIPAAFSSGGFFFADIQNNQVDTAGLAILRFIAALGEGAIVSRKALSQQFPDVVESTLNLLLQRELIEEVGEGYKFQVELIRQWFAQK